MSGDDIVPRVDAGTLTALGLPSDRTDEVVEIAKRLPNNTWCIATGSIVEGFGNANSDIDLYVVYDTGAPKQSVSIGLRRSHYVDCEYMTDASLRKLAGRVAGHSWATITELHQDDLDRYYRLAIGLPLRSTQNAETTLALFDKSVACLAFSRWAAAAAYEHLCLASSQAATGADREAWLSLREAALWQATGRLAAEGEGYVGVKWLGEKAARRYGRDSAAFRQLVDEYLRPSGTIADLLARRRAAVDVPADLTKALTRRRCTLAEDVRFVADGGEYHLVRRNAFVARVRNSAAALCHELATGLSWQDAVRSAATSLGVPPAEFAVAAWSLTEPLRRSGFLRLPEAAREH